MKNLTTAVCTVSILFTLMAFAENLVQNPSFEEQLTSVMGTMEEKVTGCADTPEKMYMLSKDIARVILADIYMYLGRYADAKPLLENIVNSNRYSLVPLIDNLDSECSEVIWSMPDNMPNRARGTVSLYNEDLCIMQTYGDVLLSLAECETKLGNDDKAKIYLNQVTTTKGIETTSTETLVAISEVRSMMQNPGLTQNPGYE